jgi:hypothetical protein
MLVAVSAAFCFLITLQLLAAPFIAALPLLMLFYRLLSKIPVAVIVKSIAFAVVIICRNFNQCSDSDPHLFYFVDWCPVPDPGGKMY